MMVRKNMNLKIVNYYLLIKILVVFFLLTSQQLIAGENYVLWLDNKLPILKYESREKCFEGNIRMNKKNEDDGFTIQIKNKGETVIISIIQNNGKLSTIFWTCYLENYDPRK